VNETLGGPVPVIVRLGVLTLTEWTKIEPELRSELESNTEDFLAQYGEQFFTKNIERHRRDLSLAYGVC
jgi:hypothetical protein